MPKKLRGGKGSPQSLNSEGEMHWEKVMDWGHHACIPALNHARESESTSSVSHQTVHTDSLTRRFPTPTFNKCTNVTSSPSSPSRALVVSPQGPPMKNMPTPSQQTALLLHGVAEKLAGVADVATPMPLQSVLQHVTASAGEVLDAVAASKDAVVEKVGNAAASVGIGVQRAAAATGAAAVTEAAVGAAAEARDAAVHAAAAAGPAAPGVAAADAAARAAEARAAEMAQHAQGIVVQATEASKGAAAAAWAAVAARASEAAHEAEEAAKAKAAGGEAGVEARMRVTGDSVLAAGPAAVESIRQARAVVVIGAEKVRRQTHAHAHARGQDSGQRTVVERKFRKKLSISHPVPICL